MNGEQFGVMTRPCKEYTGAVYNLHAYMEYCIRNEKKPDELTLEERQQFEVPPAVSTTA